MHSTNIIENYIQNIITNSRVIIEYKAIGIDC